MKGTNIVIAIIVLLILIGGGWYLYSSSSTAPGNGTGTTTTPGAGQARITFPAGGEVLAPGHTYTLLWDTPSVPSATSTQIFLIDASLETQGASVSTVDRLYGVLDSGTFPYTIPKTVHDGVYRIEVGTLMSQPFQISSSSPSVSTSTPTTTNTQ